MNTISNSEAGAINEGQILVERYQKEYAPLVRRNEKFREMIEIGEETKHFMVIEGRKISNDDMTRQKAIELSELNRNISKSERASTRDDIKSEYGSESVLRRRQELRNWFRSYIEQTYGNVFVLLDKYTETRSSDGRLTLEMQDYLIDSLVDYVRLRNVTDNRQIKQDGVYFGIGHDVLGKFINRRFGGKLMGHLLKAPYFSEFAEDFSDVEDESSLYREVERRYTQGVADLTILDQDIDLKKLALRAWLIEKTRKRTRIAGTEFDRKNIQKIRESRRQENGVAGAIAYGSPGTGKTELFIYANALAGFETKVISMDQHTDFVRLVGEMSIPLGLDRKASYSDRLIGFRKFMTELDNESLQKILGEIGVDSSVLAKFIPELAEKLLLEGRVLSADDIVDFREGILRYVNREIIAVEMGMAQGLDPETSWVYGEVIAAFKEGKMPLLDEIDKGSEKSLDGISYLLSMKPGDKITLGNSEFVVPIWGRIDGTCNSLVISDYLQNRFAPNIFLIDYPPAPDLMKKSMIWLADEQGNLGISIENDSRMAAFLCYVVPEIQRMYVMGELANPFSMRNINKLCQFVKSGHTIDEAVEFFILKRGSLTHSDTELERLKRLIASFNDICRDDDIVIAAEDISFNPSGMQRVLESSLYTGASEDIYFGDSLVTHLSLVELTETQRDKISASLFDQDSMTREYSLRNGLDLLISDENNDLLIAGPDGDSLINWRCDGITENSVIAGASSDGREIIVMTDGKYMFYSLINGEKNKGLECGVLGDEICMTLSGSIVKKDKSGNLFIGVVGSGGLKYRQVLLGNRNIPVVRFSVSNNGRFVLLEDSSGRSYFLNLDREISSDEERINIKKPLRLSGKDWLFVGSNLMYSPDSKQSYIIK